MGRIFYIMGKSGSGKDTVYNALLHDPEFHFSPIILHTTRPVRDGELNGREYYFTDEKTFHEMSEKGEIIETRSYHTIHGIWTYFTAKSALSGLDRKDYLGIGTIESFLILKKYFSDERICPVYLEVEDGERLSRALARERQQAEPKYEEMCRRFLADQKDFREEILKDAGIEKKFSNDHFENCVEEIRRFIRSMQ